MYADVAKALELDKILVPRDIENLVWYYRQLWATEKGLAKRLDAWSQNHPLRTMYLSRIMGIGPILASGIIAWAFYRFPNISKLWAYMGLSSEHWENKCKEDHKSITTSPPAICPVKVKTKVRGRITRVPCNADIVSREKVPTPPKKKKGYVLMINLKLKTFAWKIAASFEKQDARKSQYRRTYEVKKALYAARPEMASALLEQRKRQEVDEEAKGGPARHIQLRTMRATVKEFLLDLWIVERSFMGLTVTQPYAVAVLGHADEGKQPKFDDGKPVPLNPIMAGQDADTTGEREIRYLVNNYYDVQKLRLATGGRIVAYVKDNWTKYKEAWEPYVKRPKVKLKRKKPEEL